MGVDVGDVEVAAATARAVAVELEVGSLTTAECERGLRAAAAMESSAGAMKAMFAARLSATDAHASTSAASPEAHVAAITGVSPAAARAQIELGGQLTGAVGSALKAGEVSTPQAQAIASAARANPKAEAALLAAAPNLTLGQLRERCAKVTADADPDPDATHARLREGRCGRRYGTADGFHHLHVQSTAEDLAEIDVTLNPIVDELFAAARRGGRRERREAYLADAIVEMARRARGAAGAKAPPTYTAVIRADLSALVNGRAAAGEVCEIAGIGPVPVEVARKLLGEAVLKLVLTHGVDVRNVTSLGRGPTAAQKVALLWEQPTCSVERCGRRARLEADHTTGAEWATTRHTRLDELDRLCDQHHDKKTYDGWGLVPGTGVRPMVPPGHPRHPKHGTSPPAQAEGRQP